MNNLWKKFRSGHSGKNRMKNVVISIVILIEIFALCIVGTFAWVETVSSIKITNEANTHGDVDTYVYTEAEITSQKAQWTHTDGFIDLAKYFKKSGNMHLAPASSADGKNFFFPQVASTGYRQGNVSDKNTTYMSITFKLRVEDNVDFFFYKPDSGSGPTFTGSGESFDDEDIRVSVTAYSEGNSPTAADTKVYAKTADDDVTVVNGRSSSDTTEVDLKSFTSAVKGSGSDNKLFSVGADETKIVTINLWLQSNDSNMNSSTNLSENITIQDLGIISSMTPRHVTLVPGSAWRSDNPTFYAWCYNATNGAQAKLFKLNPNTFDGTYSFDYPGNYQDMVFVRAKPAAANYFDTDSDNPGTTLPSGTDFWTDYVWNQTEDASVPPTPVDPTYFIHTIDGSDEYWKDGHKKSTGAYEQPAVIRLKYVDGQDENWGTLSGVYDSYTSTFDDSSDVKQVRMITRGSVTGTTRTFQAKASVTNVTGQSYSNYAFVGWYTDPAGTIPATGFTTSTSGNTTTSTHNTPARDTDTTYYAKFREVRTLTIIKYIDGAVATASSGTVGTIKINNDTSAATVISKSVTVDKGDPVAYSAAAATNSGYSLDGIFTAAREGTKVYSAGASDSSIVLNDNTTYYARFTTNSYNVQANAYYSTDGGTSYSAGSTGGTVKVGSSAAGATSTASVKYKSTVDLVAYPEDGYEFVGWYSAATGGTQLSTNTTYPYTLSTIGAKNVYARFMGEEWSIKYGVSGASSWNSEAMTVSGNTVSGSMTLTEGQDFSFQIVKTVGSTNTWYGGNGSYENITSTSFISNKTLSVDGGDIYMKGHAGTYTFTFNKSTNKLNVSVAYSDITIYFDYSSTTWVTNDGAKIKMAWSSGDVYEMSGPSNNTFYATTKSNNTTGFWFNRHYQDGNNNTQWPNNWNAGSRGYSTTYKTSGNGTGSWQ